MRNVNRHAYEDNYVILEAIAPANTAVNNVKPAPVLLSMPARKQVISPRAIYEFAGVDVPDEATDELQRNHDRERCTATMITTIRRALTPRHTTTL